MRDLGVGLNDLFGLNGTELQMHWVPIHNAQIRKNMVFNGLVSSASAKPPSTTQNPLKTTSHQLILIDFLYISHIAYMVNTIT